MTNAQTVFLVDDDLDFRESLSWLLESAGYSVVAFESAEEFLNNYLNNNVDNNLSNNLNNNLDNNQQPAGCLLLDVRMAGMSGLALQKELLERRWVIPVIMITGHGDIDVAVQAMKNQAVDFIEKPFDDAAILKLVDDTLIKSEQIFSDLEKIQKIRERWDSLSKRETSVAELVIQGLVNREIAEALGISIKTVEIHRSRVMSKMQAKRITDLLEMVHLIQ